MNTAVRINERNKWAIHDFCQGNTHRITGTRLKALHRLVQKKGEPMQTKDEQLSGVKVLEYTSGSYVGFIHEPYKKDSFFPCKIKTIQLTNL